MSSGAVSLSVPHPHDLLAALIYEVDKLLSVIRMDGEHKHQRKPLSELTPVIGDVVCLCPDTIKHYASVGVLLTPEYYYFCGSSGGVAQLMSAGRETHRLYTYNTFVVRHADSHGHLKWWAS